MKRVSTILSGLAFLVLLLAACSKDVDEALLPKIETIEVLEDEYAPGTIVVKAQITDSLMSSITSAGFYTHTENSSKLKNWQYRPAASVSKDLQITITDFEPGKTYFIKAVAENSYGEGFGKTIEYKARPYRFGSFTDTRDNKTYRTVKIGDQEWLAENFAYLPQVFPYASISSNRVRYYVFEHQNTVVDQAKESQYYKKYGVMYNWVAALDAVPQGWKLPSKADWDKLLTYTAQQYAYSTANPMRFEQLAKHLKAYGFDQGQNNFGLSVYAYTILMQEKNPSAPFTESHFWTSDEASTFAAQVVKFLSNNNDVYYDNLNKLSGLPIRLVKE